MICSCFAYQKYALKIAIVGFNLSEIDPGLYILNKVNKIRQVFLLDHFHQVLQGYQAPFG